MRIFCSGSSKRRLAVAALLACLAGFVAGCGVFSPQQIPVPDAVCAGALEEALGVTGAPYVWGARGSDEFDCSGLITWAYKAAMRSVAVFRVGNQQTTDASMQDLWQYNIIPLLPADVLPGDIVFITSEQDRITHGGLFIRWVGDDEFEFINASSYHGQVTVDTWSVNGTKREQWFVGAGRLKMAY